MRSQFRLFFASNRVLLAFASMLWAAASLNTLSAQTVTLNNTSVNFGNVAEGSTSSRSVTLRNTSTTTALSISSIVANGPFTQTNTCGGSVAARGSCAITITFAPLALGAQTGTVLISDNATPATQTITLSGTGIVPLTVSNTSVSFGSVGVGSTSSTASVGVRNNQSQAAALTVSTAAPFAQTNTCASLAAGANCTIRVTFNPTALGTQTGSLTIAYAGAGSPITVTLSGTGVVPISISPSSRSLGNVAQGTTSPATTFTVRNQTKTAIPITVLSTNPQFAVSGCTSVPTSNCTLSVTFAPPATETGTQSGNITVSYPGATTPLTVAVTGTAVAALIVSPTSIAYSNNLPFGTSSAQHTVQLTNNTSSQAVPLTSIVASPAAFAITRNGCTASLAAGRSCNVGVTFTPTVLGITNGTLTITYGNNLQQVVTLTGGAQVNGLVSIVITAPNTSIPMGTGEQLTATGQYVNGAVGNVTTVATWNSAATGVATVSTTGAVTGVAPGSAPITATVTPTGARTVTGRYTVTVTRVLTGVTIAGTLGSTTPIAPPSIAAGTTQQVYATGTYSDGTSQDVTAQATWSSTSSDATVAGGLITAVSPGPATIGAAFSGISSTVGVTVTGKVLTGITLAATVGSTTPIAPPTLAAGTNLQIYATGSYNDGSTQDITSQASWSSTTASATVVNGLVTAVSTGTATIGAALSGMSTTVGTTVTAATLQSLAITPPGNTTIAAGTSQQYTATGTYTDHSTQNITSTVTWSSSVAGVTMSATTPGLAVSSDSAVGTPAIINAVIGAVSATSTATLTVSPAALASISVTPANPSIASGTTQPFTATGTYTDNTTQDLTSTATWSATTLSGGGAATFTGTTGANVAKATAPGVVTITATSGPVNGSTTLTVTAPTLTSIVVTTTAPASPPAAGTPAVATIYQGKTQQFYALGTYSDSSIQDITSTVAWSAGTGSVATISTSGATAGLATSVAAGTVAISATSGSIVSTTSGGDGTLTVIGLSSVTVTPANPMAPLGDANSTDPYGTGNNTLQFTATATYADSTTENVTASSTWTSGTQAVASIGGTTGVATLLTVGTSTVTATYGGTSGQTLLTVQSAVLESLSVCLGAYPSSTCGAGTTSVGATLGLNATQQFSALGTYSDGSTQDLTSVATWAAHDPQEVTVNATGLATVVATDNGAHAITASYGTISAYLDPDTAWITASTTAPISCPTPTINLQLLVINNAEANSGAGYADFPAIQQILNYVGTPYTVVDVSAPAPALCDRACHGYFQGVIFAYGGDYYNIPTWQTALINYEKTFGIRQLNWYDFPDPNFGLTYTGTQIPSTQTYTTNFTTAAAPVFFYANTATPLTINNASVDLAAATPAIGGSLTPLLQDSQNNVVSAIYNYAGQQFLTQSFDSNPYLTHDLVLAYGLLNWVTNGVFLGDYHIYATQEVDDFFIDDSEWIPSTTCLTNLATKDRTAPDASNLPVFRVDANDMSQLVTWQNGIQTDPSGLFSQFQLTLAFNGVGTTGNGDWTGLVAPIVSTSASGGVGTFTAQGFSGLPGQQVTVTNTTNGGGALNGTWTILATTSSAATNPGTTTFTANVLTTATITQAAENGVADNPATAMASVADDLVANLANYQANFHWISHTYDHPTSLNGLCQSVPNNTGVCTDIYDSPPVDYIDLEILTNRWVASDPAAQPSWMLDQDSSDTVRQLTFTDFNPGNIITPGVTGLNDPSVPAYLYTDGIRYAVSDTSVATTTNPPNNNGPNPFPNVGIVNSYAPGVYEIPRHPNDVFYNAANWADDQAEFVCIYQNYVPPTAPPGTVPAPDPPFNTYNSAQILDFTSTTFVNNMLMGDMDPQMFHQPDLHFGNNYAALSAPLLPGNAGPQPVIPGLANPHVSSLISDTYNLTFTKYKTLYKLPVLSPTLDQMGVLMQNRNSFNLSGATAMIVGANSANPMLQISMPTGAPVTSATIPVTGLTSNGSELYGGQNISHINITPGTTITLPLP